MSNFVLWEVWFLNFSNFDILNPLSLSDIIIYEVSDTNLFVYSDRECEKIHSESLVKKVKVKVFRYKPGVALGVPGG